MEYREVILLRTKEDNVLHNRTLYGYPMEKDHFLLWGEYDEIEGKMFAEMQNWALEQCFKCTDGR